VRALLLALLLAGCGSAASHTAEGDEQLRLGELEAAERAYNRALVRDPHHAPAVYGKGWAFLQSELPELREPARKLFQRAVDYGPEFYGGYRGLGVMFMQDGQVRAAEDHFRKAFERAPTDVSVLVSYGLLYLGGGRLDDAEALFRAAIDAGPGRGELYRYLSDVALARGDLDGALELLAVGRGSAVSGRGGLLLLDEGEARLHFERASRASTEVLGGWDPKLDEALQALDRADTVLTRAEGYGIGAAELARLRKATATLRADLERRKRQEVAPGP
jgi:tetratricopeptide (TPR) repeat protein